MLFPLPILHPLLDPRANRLSGSCTCGYTHAYSRARPRVTGYASAYACKRAHPRVFVLLARSYKRHTTVLNKTSGLASPRANYPHLFLDRTYVSEQPGRLHPDIGGAAVAAAAADAARSRAPACPVAQPSMIFPVSRTIGSIDNYRRHFYTRDVPPSSPTKSRRESA